MTGESSAPDTVPNDQAARDAIATDLDTTIFVEAGAGSGKTSCLVDRVVTLLLTGRARIDQVAVITFTEAAAAELRDRIAATLEGAATGAVGREASTTASDALAGLEMAAITTLHGFSRRILAEHPFEAGLPPVFEVYDQARSAVAFEARWAVMLDAICGEPAAARALQRLLVCGGTLDGLRTVARRLSANWDLLPAAGPPTPLPEVDASGVVAGLEAALALAGRCTDRSDRLRAHLVGLEPFTRRLKDAVAAGEELSVLDVVAGRTAKLTAAHLGRTSSWGDAKAQVAQHLDAAEEARQEVVGGTVHVALRCLGSVLAGQTLVAAGERRRDGHLEFHDLLVMARDLVRDDAEVRSALHEQYRYVLVDEYQDTDPIQAELALSIAAGPAAGGGGAGPWGALPVEPGRLFFVGDPVQSIYGFRRADLALFRRTRDEVPDRLEPLTTNFRSVPGVVSWNDAVFGRLLGDAGTSDEGAPPSRPAYTPSNPARPAATWPAGKTRPPVTVLGAGTPATGAAEEALRREAREVAAIALDAWRQGWPVGVTGRPAGLADVTVLIPTRGPLPALQEAFDAAGVPYRLESSSLVFASAEVRDLITVLRAIDDPTDELSVVAALRSPGFGCGDDDLVRHRLARGGWDYRLDPPPETAGGPVASGLGWLRQVHEKRAWLEVSELVRLVIDDRRLMLLALDDRRWREGWRRLRFVADLARQFTESSPGDHRRFLAWLDVQAGDNAGVTEVVLPEPDLEAVRVMTIHAAKGLEFPVVVVAGLGGGRRPNGREVLFGERGPEIGLRKDLCTDGHPELSEQRAAIEEEERLRLLYVAATRAQDHLVVSVHRGQRAGESLAGRLAAALEQVDEALWVAAEPGGSVPAGSVPGGTLAPRGSPPSHEAEWSGAAPVEGPDERAAWDEARRLLLAEPPRVVAATGVARLVPDRTGPGHHGDTGCDDVDGITGAGDPAGDDPGAGDPAGDDIRPPWRRGRAGTAVGRAVHAVLQAVDLVGGADLEALASAHADAEAIPARVAEVAALARAGLRSETVRAAVGSRRYWRELYVGVPLGSRVLEGFVDLLYEGADGLEVVDYKTDQVAGDADLDGAVRRYRLQGAAYALAVEEAVGAPVERCTFLFLRPDGAVARTVGDLAAAKQEVRVLVEGAGGGPQAPETLDDG